MIKEMLVVGILMFALFAPSENAQFLREEDELVVQMESGHEYFRESFPLSRFFEDGQTPKSTQMLGFSWSNCGDPHKDPLVIKSMSLSPDPLSLPGKIILNMNGSLGKTIESPLKVDVVLEKKMWIWVKIPCVDNVGSCTYDDVCSMLPKGSCPQIFIQQHVPCKCPFKQGMYKLTNASVNIKGGEVPSGSYRMTAKFSTNGVAVGCYKMSVSFK